MSNAKQSFNSPNPALPYANRTRESPGAGSWQGGWNSDEGGGAKCYRSALPSHKAWRSTLQTPYVLAQKGLCRCTVAIDPSICPIPCRTDADHLCRILFASGNIRGEKEKTSVCWRQSALQT
eukprot:3165649-Rhodomonas_salina.1